MLACAGPGWQGVAGAEVSVTIPETAVLSGDPSTLQQVVMNLVTNAADAIAESGSERPGKIDLRVTEEIEGVTLTITDNGPGIPEEIAAHIYDALFTTKKEDRGTGLGLYVVRQIVEESGGSIDYRTEAGCGTEFTVILPPKLLRLGTDDQDTTVTALEPTLEPTV